ncbi:MAG: helix-turn-helix transcriptional regulator [Methyloceanibacter sp.]
MNERIHLLGWDDLQRKGIRLSKVSIYRKLKEGRFPKPAYVGRSPVWVEAEIDEYIRDLIAARRVAP